MSAAKVDITQGVQDSAGAHGITVRPSVFAENAAYHFLCICAFFLFSNDNKAAMSVLLFSTFERCYYFLPKNLLFQMTYPKQCGPWFAADCHGFS